ncbi:MAG: hypothetical protein FWG45_06645 [Oscillospiraceae bacterium]|nr:hypothetical protein [Oscillospiraceae bacterium]
MDEQILLFITYCRENRIYPETSLKQCRLDLNEFQRVALEESGGDEADLDAYTAFLKSNYKSSEIKRKNKAVKTFFDYLQETDVIDENPFGGKPQRAVKSPKTPKEPKQRPVKSPRPQREKRELPKLNPKAIKIAAITAGTLVLVVGAVYLISTIDFESPVSDTDTDDDDKPTPTHYFAPEPSPLETTPTEPPNSPATSPPTADITQPTPTSPTTSPPTADVTQPTLTESPTQPPPSSAGQSRQTTPTQPPTSPTTSSPRTPTTARPATTKKPTPTQPPPVNVGTPSISASKSNNSVTLSWTAVTDADGYEVSRSTTMIGGYSVLNAIAVRDGSTIKVTDSGTNSGTTYYYSVRAFRNVGGVKHWGSHSEIVTVRG